MLLLALTSCSWFTIEPEVPHTLDANDHAVLIDGRDLQVVFPNFVPEDERWEKTSEGDDWQLSYGSLGDEFAATFFYFDDPNNPWLDDSDIEYLVHRMGWRFQPKPELVTVGDAHTCGLLVGRGVPIGNACAVRQGHRMWVVIIETRPVTTPGALDPLFIEALRTGAHYEPVAAPKFRRRR